MSNYCTPSFNSHWIKSRYLANRYSMKFENIWNGKSTGFSNTDELDVSLTVIKRSNSQTQYIPFLNVKDNQFEFVTRNLEDGEYLYSLKVAYSNSTSDYAIVSFDYEVEKSIYMIFISVLYYIIFGLIFLDAVVHNKYTLFRYFIYSSQMIHLTGILNVSSPPSIIYFVQNLWISSFTSPLYTRKLMSSKIETQSSSFYNAGFESTKSILILSLPLLLLVIMAIIIIVIYFTLDLKIFNWFDANKRAEFTKNIKKSYWKFVIFNCWMKIKNILLKWCKFYGNRYC